MIFVTSDSHFSHANILKYEPKTRPFKTVEEMNEELIRRWNETVMPDDTVIHCGDFFMGERDNIDRILPRLNGKIILTKGNHDTKGRLKKYEEYGVEVHDIYYLPYKGKFFIFCHFPIVSEEFMNMIRGDNEEVIFCYGHVHSQAEKGFINGTFHAGVDTNELYPVALDDILMLCRREEKNKHN